MTSSAGAPREGSPFRCAAASLGRAEPLEGTASTVRAFLLLEASGPWGVHAVRDCRLDEQVRQRLLDLERDHRVRPLLIRRHGRSAAGPRRIFAVHASPTAPWAQTAVLDDIRDLLALDLTGLAAGVSPGLTPHPDPLFLVCTHGRHDACCAEQGRPLARALSHAAGDQAWEVSHIGGDRFAANALVLPHGLYYGRLTAEDAPRFVAEHRAGRVVLEHLRGRSSYPFAVQAAEIHLRRHLGEPGIASVRAEGHERSGDVTTARFRAGDGRWVVRVRTDRTEATQLTCRATRPSPGIVHALLDVREVRATHDPRGDAAG